MQTKNTQYRFQTTMECPVCYSTRVVEFETEDETKIIRLHRCQACGLENTSVYELSLFETDVEPEYIYAKTIKRTRESELIGEPENEILFGP